ncbi:hypothetical protein N7486_010201 [Penicillium sp. IBT 16267x]|nr:hypothetical protein N7486_010201 [Penicillium sp. IBT 16267x]
MDHISTLCALSTIGIASTGLALGRVERTKQSILRRKTLPYDQPLPKLTESTPVDVRPETSRSGRPNPAGAAWTLNANETDSDSSRGNQSQEPDLRRASLSFGAARFRRRGQTLTNPPLRIPENEPAESHSRRPSTGWLRRLSMASFQTESPSTNSPVTPSFDGSASPIFPRPHSQRRSPNKLVKRTSSQHSNIHPLFVNTSVSPTSGLRRPATSYQRSETMRLQSPLITDFESRFSERYSVESPAIEEFGVDTQDDWKPYFLPKSEAFSGKLARKLPSGNPKAASVRRITSDQDSLPALVLATTITTKTHAQLDHQTTPTTPVMFRNPFQNETHAVDQITPLPTPPPEKRAHRHSYSLNDVEPKKIVVNTVTASGTPIIGRPRGGSLKRVKGRTFSIPQSELSKLEKAIPGSPPAPPQRRNITDPSVFRRPHALSPPGLSLSNFGREFQVGPRSVSQDFPIGLPRHRPLTSDAVALSTWQHSCRPEANMYSSLRRRPKRHSITASDPSSTVIGSDDTRVFTSSDEYETDMMTDYWDSIRTRGTNGDGVKGLRIETMFDKAGTRLSNEEVTTLEDLLPRGSFASRMERDPPLFPGSLLPAAPVHINDLESLSGDEEETRSMIGGFPGESDLPSSHTPLTIPFSEQNRSGLPPTMLSSSPIEELRVSQKMNIFDWSEQSRTDRDMSDSDARPRTVHGKQNGLDRGSRAACRKVPSAIHLRSQSVPVARDVAPSDSRQTSGKFGTWGLGSKGVSEDWDSDFDFEDDAEEATPSQDTKTTVSEGPSQIMTVPQAILERQASLRGQFGQVQELTLLVEELKRLRHQASVLDLLGGPSSELWKEAEGIVNLATIDEDEDRRSPPGSPSSLTFSFDDSDEEGLNVSSKHNSTASWHGSPPQAGPLSPPPFKPPKASHGSPSQQESQLYSSPLRQLSKDSPESKSVLDVLQPSQRPESSTLPRLTPSSRSQKLPFDTSSLRDLVVRAGVITRALKEVIRKAEGVEPNSEDVFPSDPPFRRIFDQPSHDAFAGFEAELAEMH